MEYSIKELANIAGVSTRTLRYYDQIDLLKPLRKSEAGYRIYGSVQLDRLQLIMFYRELDFKLDDIQRIFDEPEFNLVRAMQEQYRLLERQQDRITSLLNTLETTIKSYQGDINMEDSEKFAAFKQNKIKENEEKYGAEIREEYGDETVNDSNKLWNNLSAEQYQIMNAVESDMVSKLIELDDSKLGPSSELGKQIYEDHKRWLEFSWKQYTPAMHRNLADMYLADSRFGDYYNSKAGREVVQLLHDVIYEYTNN
ncbi:MerR family transcriptional regulator [Companilactobacillus ginsenosidimutans]|uniref:MerR family transcriptional regulator n=1 Tax=Companilactobacillus ginsenosidimutans TaxID=1007676 RepID=A0A0H4QKV5_9LACO|nr:MerR family transcriptional regulator [Companilactobacillus ginsenosidimutans]AKP67726.1 MerR family transcriptional regulator [Companilactobacillus ginsenosidimutans]